jgi:hypothetical protein
MPLALAIVDGLALGQLNLTSAFIHLELLVSYPIVSPSGRVDL